MLYELQGVTREFKGRKVLNLPHLALESGKIYSLIGHNGAGKTRLLNILAFLDRPTAGEIHFCGEEVSYNKQSLLALRRRVVLVDQYPILFTGPVWKNVQFGLKVRGVPHQERTDRVHEVLALVGMDQFFKAEAEKLSGGETKRVALAMALAVRPEVLLCDEPCANVDEENQEIIIQILDRINREQNTSVIFSTHYLAQGRSLAHEVLHLEHGRLCVESERDHNHLIGLV
ncbi:MAG: ATPase component of ABC-type sugar [Desulfobulbaceae bacterium]|jgi:tungstate transport system ATP-binding protein|nr:MAG: ATPase component of ABC-type sugar [Desulfobulbaceae bacterium]